MQRKFEGKMEGKEWEFYRRMMGEESYFRKIDDNGFISLPITIARSLRLEGGMPCRIGWDGDSLTLTPLNGTETPMKIQPSKSNKSLGLKAGVTHDTTKITKGQRDYGPHFSVYIPTGMRGKLENGDEVTIRVKDGKIYVTKG